MTLTSPRPVTHTHTHTHTRPPHLSTRHAAAPASHCAAPAPASGCAAPRHCGTPALHVVAGRRLAPHLSLAAARAGLLVGVGPPGCTGSSPPPPPPAPPRHSHGVRVRVRVRVCVCARQRLARATRRAAPRRGSVRPRWRPHIAHCTRVVERVSEGVTRPSAPLHPATHSARVAAPPRASSEPATAATAAPAAA
jgi:hypothetical protein